MIENLYFKFIDFAYKNHCFWYRVAQKEKYLHNTQKKPYINLDDWKDCLNCREDVFCTNYDLDPNHDLESIIRDLNL